MADRLTAVTAQRLPLPRLLLAFVMAGAFALSGCEAVSMPDLSKIDLGLGKPRPTVMVKAGYASVNIRSTPATTHPPIAQVKGGEQLILLEEYEDWLNVRFYDTSGDERQGWIYKYLLDGYDKPTSGASVAPEEAASRSSKSSSVGAPPAAPALRALPKSDTVSPL